jgi:hypothetical protein
MMCGGSEGANRRNSEGSEPMNEAAVLMGVLVVVVVVLTKGGCHERITCATRSGSPSQCVGRGGGQDVLFMYERATAVV